MTMLTPNQKCMQPCWTAHCGRRCAGCWCSCERLGELCSPLYRRGSLMLSTLSTQLPPRNLHTLQIGVQL